MQEVIVKEKKITSLYLEDLTDASFIGVEFNPTNRGFVQRIDEGYYVISTLGIDKANQGYICKVKGSTIQQLLGEKVFGHKTYVFDTAHELMLWIAESFKN